MTARASGLLSISTNRRPSAWAASPTVPLPAKKSITTPPGGHEAWMMRPAMPTGFCVG